MSEDRSIYRTPAIRQEYQLVIDCGDIPCFERAVNALLAEGWELHGATQITADKDDRFWYSQAMTRYQVSDDDRRAAQAVLDEIAEAVAMMDAQGQVLDV